MASDEKKPRSFSDLQSDYGGTAGQQFSVRSRGRPALNKQEAKDREDRRQAFWRKLKQLREAQGLTLRAAADAAGIASARKLCQYETKCYPPGWVLTALAPVYRVPACYLAALKIACEDPATWKALHEGLTPEDFAGVLLDEDGAPLGDAS